MREIDSKITVTKIMMVVVVLVGLLISYLIVEPIIQQERERIARGTHLAGEVYTAKDLMMTLQPARLYIDKWETSGYTGDFVNNGYNFKHGVGMYIPSKSIPKNGTASTKLGYWLAGGYNQVYFNLCTDTNWTAGPNGGKYRIKCYVNGSMVHDTGFNDYTYSEKIKLDVTGADDLVIELEQKKGIDGTLNVILGEFEINKLSR